MKRNICLLILAGLLLSVSVYSQVADRFTVATLNIDGLPQKILVFNVNANGPGDAGTSRIGKYLNKKAFDIVCTQEDFNYHDVLTPWLEDDYRFDTWSGAIGIDLPGKKFDFLHAQNEQFDCDGLGACWKNDIVMTATERVPWNQMFGKFSHAGDALVKKGYRRSELTLANGARIIVYNLHMDASYIVDEKEGKDILDRQARQSQWQQLLVDVLDHLDTRPIIIMGDMNSYYCRDRIKTEFIDKIAESGKGTASDVWVELEKGGNYPAVKEGIIFTEDPANLLDGEAMDKIIYINPTTGTQLSALAFEVDTEGYQYEGKPLGDHYPMSATFQIKANRSTAISPVLSKTTGDRSSTYYNIKGERISQPTKGLYIEQREHSSNKFVIK